MKARLIKRIAQQARSPVSRRPSLLDWEFFIRESSCNSCLLCSGAGLLRRIFVSGQSLDFLVQLDGEAEESFRIYEFESAISQFVVDVLLQTSEAIHVFFLGSEDLLFEKLQFDGAQRLDIFSKFAVPIDQRAFGDVQSSSGQSLQDGTDVSEGGDSSTQPAQATSAVRSTEQSWATFLRASLSELNRRARCGNTARRDL